MADFTGTADSFESLLTVFCVSLLVFSQGEGEDGFGLDTIDE